MQPEQVAFFRHAFLAHGPQRYALMQSEAHCAATGHKYYERRGALSDHQIAQHLAGGSCYAVPVAHVGLSALLSHDVDAGGLPAVLALLAAARQRSLWAFGQYDPVRGRGYVWVPFTELVDNRQLVQLGHELIAEVAQPGWSIENRNATSAVTRLPLGRHRWSGRFGLLLLDDQVLDLDQDHAGGLAALLTSWSPNAPELLPPLPPAPPAPEVTPAHPGPVTPAPAPTVTPRSGPRGSVTIARFNAEHSLERLLLEAGAELADPRNRLFYCPFHNEGERPNLWITKDGQRCGCNSPKCRLNRARGFDAFNIHCLRLGIDPEDRDGVRAELRRLNGWDDPAPPRTCPDGPGSPPNDGGGRVIPPLAPSAPQRPAERPQENDPDAGAEDDPPGSVAARPARLTRNRADLLAAIAACPTGHWRGHAHLAALLRVDRRTVERGLRWLEGHGLIRSVNRGREGQTNIYRTTAAGRAIAEGGSAFADHMDHDSVLARSQDLASRGGDDSAVLPSPGRQRAEAPAAPIAGAVELGVVVFPATPTHNMHQPERPAPVCEPRPNRAPEPVRSAPPAPLPAVPEAVEPPALALGDQADELEPGVVVELGDGQADDPEALRGPAGALAYPGGAAWVPPVVEAERWYAQLVEQLAAAARVEAGDQADHRQAEQHQLVSAAPTLYAASSVQFAPLPAPAPPAGTATATPQRRGGRTKVRCDDPNRLRGQIIAAERKAAKLARGTAAERRQARAILNQAEIKRHQLALLLERLGDDQAEPPAGDQAGTSAQLGNLFGALSADLAGFGDSQVQAPATAPRPRPAAAQASRPAPAARSAPIAPRWLQVEHGGGHPPPISSSAPAWGSRQGMTTAQLAATLGEDYAVTVAAHEALARLRARFAGGEAGDVAVGDAAPLVAELGGQALADGVLAGFLGVASEFAPQELLGVQRPETMCVAPGAGVDVEGLAGAADLGLDAGDEVAGVVEQPVLAGGQPVEQQRVEDLGDLAVLAALAGADEDLAGLAVDVAVLEAGNLLDAQAGGALELEHQAGLFADAGEDLVGLLGGEAQAGSAAGDAGAEVGGHELVARADPAQLAEAGFQFAQGGDGGADAAASVALGLHVGDVGAKIVGGELAQLAQVGALLPNPLHGGDHAPAVGRAGAVAVDPAPGLPLLLVGVAGVADAEQTVERVVALLDQRAAHGRAPPC
ncbi:MAG TPA: hypothetical protein VFS21_40130 [Roseiflexaceae bacterium]|nr:hypothetical protein [Roseiflexaceae bacterium]